MTPQCGGQGSASFPELARDRPSTVSPLHMLVTVFIFAGTPGAYPHPHGRLLKGRVRQDFHKAAHKQPLLVDQWNVFAESWTRPARGESQSGEHDCRQSGEGWTKSMFPEAGERSLGNTWRAVEWGSGVMEVVWVREEVIKRRIWEQSVDQRHWWVLSHIPIGRRCLRALMRFRREKPGIISGFWNQLPQAEMKYPAPKKDRLQSLWLPNLTRKQGESSLKYAKCLGRKKSNPDLSGNSVANSVSGIMYKEHEQLGVLRVSPKPRNSIKAPPARVTGPSCLMCTL